MLRVVLLTLLVALAGPAMVGPSAHYVPHLADSFSYDETVVIGSGMGDYYGYTETTSVQGSLQITAVAPNGTESASWSNSDSYQNVTGAHYHWTASGNFTFSAVTFLYVNGTDNQTGYSHPYVWFYMDDSLAVGSTFFLLNSNLSVVATDYSFDNSAGSGAYVRTIFAEGNGSFQRNDAYGAFMANYNWKAFFDPSTGYIVGYVYTERDTDNAGNGFVLTDTLGVVSTSYPLTPGTAPSSPSGSGSPSSTVLVLGILLILVIVIVVVVVALLLRSRRRGRLPEHSAYGQPRFPTAVTPPPPPIGPAPPPISLTPSGQPAVQQIVIKETVKVPCRYCGSLIDSTAEKCPFCGAART